MRRIVWIVACLVAAVTPSAHASHGPLDTLAVLNSMSFPALALDAATGDRHLAYVSDGVLTHLWESSGVWQTEAIVDSASISTYTSFQLAIAPDGHPVAAYVRKGTLVCAIRDGGGWQRDTLDTQLPAPFYPVALALHPSTGEPAVAWAHKSASPASASQIFYARHGGGTWNVQQVDTTSSSWLNVALGLDGAGRPHLAWARPRADATLGVVLTYGEGAGPDGPFTAASVDSQFSTFLTIAMDRSNGEPRLVYIAAVQLQFSIERTVRYAYRVPGGAWQWVVVEYGDGGGSPPGPALSLDPAGNPFISLTLFTAIEPGLAAHTAPSVLGTCGSVATGQARIFYRTGGAGSGPFTVEYLNDNAQRERDQRSGLLSVATRGVGQAVVVWRVPNGDCTVGLSSTEVTAPPTVGVGGERAPVVALSPPWPNPARPGQALRVAFGLPRSGRVALELHDLVGRRVATRPLPQMPAGGHSLTWSIPDLSPGHYWLTVRSGAARIGTRSLVILR